VIDAAAKNIAAMAAVTYLRCQLDRPFAALQRYRQFSEELLPR
jgi:hypothetical protein